MLSAGSKFRADFAVDPGDGLTINIEVVSKVRRDAATGQKVKMSDVEHIPLGGIRGDFTQVLDMTPTAGSDAAGVRLGGTSGAESKYTVDGANATSPAFGTVSATIVQEFIEDVEILEAGYDAEYGGGSGGQVRARRIGGTNKFPTRVWLSGGLGTYGTAVEDRVGGVFSLTHFLTTRRGGAHQIKYGTEIDSVRLATDNRYSGSNEADFYNNCPAGQKDLGEACYDPSTRAYNVTTAGRVNNNRAIIVDSNNPDMRTTQGSGRVRFEENDLRAVATPIGAGIRAQSYSATLQTQNYGVYLQDKWAILSNLYLNVGARWELQDMKDLLGRRNIFIYDNVAPRVSLVYDWTDEGKSRLYASYGWFYNQLPVLLNSRAFGGLVNVTRTYRQSDCATPTTGGEPRTIGSTPTEYCSDFNAGTTGLTAGSVVPRLRGMYRQQFQVGYEQEVIEDLVVGVNWLHTDLGRTVEDISTNGGQNFIIANPGESVSAGDISKQQATCTDLQGKLDSAEMDDPQRDVFARELNRCNFLADAYSKVGTLFNKPVQNYDAWSVKLTKRFARSWMFQGSYTYSRLVGNYDGFVARNTGAINLGASSQYDIPELVRNAYGPLFANIPHVFKLDGFYSIDLKQAGRMTLGASVRYQSGTPINVQADNNRYQGQYLVYVLPRGAGGRIEPS